MGKKVTKKQKENLDKVLRGLTRLSTVLIVLSWSLTVSSIIVWVWLGFWLFFKIILTGLYFWMIGKFISLVVDRTKETTKDLIN